MNRRLTRAFLLLFLPATAAFSAQSYGLPPQGVQSTFLRIGQFSVACTSNGVPVIWVANYGLGDVGMTIPGWLWTTVQYNPNALNAMEPDRIKLFWLGHECGHAYLRTRDETRADCWSTTTGVRQRWFDESDSDDLERLLLTNPGDETHPPGPVRAANVKSCIAAAKRAASTMTQARGPSDSSIRDRGAGPDKGPSSQSTTSTQSKRPTAAIDAAFNTLVDAITDLPPFEEKTAAGQVMRRIKFIGKVRSYCKITIDQDSTWLVKANPNVSDRSFTFTLKSITANAIQTGDSWGVRIDLPEVAIEQSLVYPEVDGKQKDDRYGNIRSATVAMAKTSDEARKLRGLFQDAARACDGPPAPPPH